MGAKIQMTINKCLNYGTLMCVLWILALVTSPAADAKPNSAAYMVPATGADISAHLQKGLLEEEANRNFEAAIAAYQKATAQYEKDRPYAATAAFRLAECYRKLGRTNDAVAQYQRVLREFGDQTNLVETSQNMLVVLKANREPETAESRFQMTIEDHKISSLKELMNNSPDLLGSPRVLHDAVREGCQRVVTFLLDNHADVNIRDPHASPNLTPLLVACQKGNKSMMELLIRRGADVNLADKTGATALHQASAYGYLAITRLLLEYKAAVNSRNQSGETALYQAAAAGHKSVVDLLLANGADVNIATVSGSTALHGAISGGWETVVDALLAAKADVSKLNDKNESPLQLAVGKASISMVKKLIAAGADVNTANKDGFTPLRVAMQINQIAIVEFLLANKADPNMPDKVGNTPLHYATKPELEEIAQLLIAHKAHINARNSHDQTPLHWAIHRQNKAMVDLLLKNGADVTVTDYLSRSGLDLILQQKRYPGLVPPPQDMPSMPLEPTKPFSSTRFSSLPKLIEDMEQLLRQHGASEFMPRPELITLVRPAQNINQTIFWQPTHNTNRFTLFEFMLHTYWPIPTGFSPGYPRTSPLENVGKLGKAGPAFPDWAKVRVFRNDPPNRTPREIPINLAEIFQSGDCSKDMALEWGDVIEIPEKEHLASESWQGLPNDVSLFLNQCLARTVTVIAKGQTNVVHWSPLYPPGTVKSPDLVKKFSYQSGWLSDFLVQRPALYLASSDLTRVKVTRTEGKTGSRQEIIFNASPTYETRDNLWLQNGDVVEIPEKQ